MENSRAMIEEKQLGLFDLLKESLKIPIRNPSFIIPAFFSSFPLFSFLIMYETVFQQTMIKILKYILQERTSPLDAIVYYYETLEASERFVEEISSKFLLCFIYLGILHLLDLFNMITVVDIGSMIYKGDQKSMNLKNMLSRCIKETRLKGPLITSIYALLLDSLVSVGLVSMVMYIYLCSVSSFFSMVFSLVFLGLLSKYIEWSAVWNMGILISILEEKHGDVALIISSYLTRGSRYHGFLLMLVYFSWRLALRSAFIYVGWDNGGSGVAVTIAHASLVCSAKMWLWLVFIVYFYDCKKKSLSGKNDEREAKWRFEGPFHCCSDQTSFSLIGSDLLAEARCLALNISWHGFYSRFLLLPFFHASYVLSAFSLFSSSCESIFSSFVRPKNGRKKEKIKSCNI